MRQGAMGTTIRILALGVTILGLLSCATQEPPPTYSKAQGKIGYTKVNMWYVQPKQIPAMNYHQGTMIPAGTRVKVLGTSGNAIPFITDADMECSLLYSSKHVRVSRDEFLARHFTDEDILAAGGRFDLFSPEEQENIVKGTLTSGMSKEAVLMAYGYPPGHRTPGMDSDTWTYWITPSKRTELTFRGGVLADVDGRPTARTVRIYVISEPAGAAIELDGQYQGRTPCVLAVRVEPEKIGQKHVIRALPTEPEAPQLGVVCGMPEAGTVLGELITVAEVLPSSPAYRLGLQPGDRIASINGKLVKSEQECFNLIRGIGFGGEVQMLVHRGAAEVRLQGKFDPPAKGTFHAKERQLTSMDVVSLHRKILHFDLRADPAAAVAAPVRATPAGPAAATAPAKDEAVPIVGTGFVVGNGGYILTALHVMGEAKAASVRSGGDAWHVAKVVKTDVVNDWCLLHAPTMTVAPMPSAPNDRPASGSAVYCAGYPVETASKKAMAAPELRRATLVAVTGLEGDRRHMQVMVSGIQGMSGAAVVDEYGEWVGIVSERLDGLIQSVAPRGAVAAGVRFALKAEAVRSSLPSEVVPASASAPEKRPTAEELGKQIQPAIVMIQLKGN